MNRVGAFIKGEAGSLSDELGGGCLQAACSFAQPTAQSDMETLLLLFPQFSYTAQKQEAYCRMLGPEASRALKMKDGSSGLVLLSLIWRRW